MVALRVTRVEKEIESGVILARPRVRRVGRVRRAARAVGRVVIGFLRSAGPRPLITVPVGRIITSPTTTVVAAATLGGLVGGIGGAAKAGAGALGGVTLLGAAQRSPRVRRAVATVFDPTRRVEAGRRIGEAVEEPRAALSRLGTLLTGPGLPVVVGAAAGLAAVPAARAVGRTIAERLGRNGALAPQLAVPPSTLTSGAVGALTPTTVQDAIPTPIGAVVAPVEKPKAKPKRRKVTRAKAIEIFNIIQNQIVR